MVLSNFQTRTKIHLFYLEVCIQVCDPLSILIAKSHITGFGSMVHYLMKRDYRMGA